MSMKQERNNVQVAVVNAALETAASFPAAHRSTLYIGESSTRPFIEHSTLLINQRPTRKSANVNDTSMKFPMKGPAHLGE
ncbi:hypothetical protein BGAL_0303g00110 [Botrytis galanthina]|uniref:Uncharacterized protein n=1 Tax=Botrytis galanthina TaxID=278940 RepID=A0A4S8QRC1_9HELO|nr:hypothetical protein BGAL_0303g00110 [Botrytis galanthina]